MCFGAIGVAQSCKWTERAAQRRFTEDRRKYLNNRVKHSVGLSAEWVKQLPPPSSLTLSPDHVLTLEENTVVDG